MGAPYTERQPSVAEDIDEAHSKQLYDRSRHYMPAPRRQGALCMP